MPRYMGAFFRTPRTARLERDFKEMQELQAQSSILEFEASGSPPEKYLVIFHGETLVPNGKIKVGKIQKAAIRLQMEYPRIRPDIQWLTPIAHPNIFNGTVCLGKFSMEWVPSVRLVEVVEIMWDMARLAILNPHSAGPGGGDDTRSWKELDRHFGFPVDKRSLRDKVARRGEGSSILRQAPDDDDDIMIIDDAGVCGLGQCCAPHAMLAGLSDAGEGFPWVLEEMIARWEEFSDQNVIARDGHAYGIIRNVLGAARSIVEDYNSRISLDEERYLDRYAGLIVDEDPDGTIGFWQHFDRNSLNTHWQNIRQHEDHRVLR